MIPLKNENSRFLRCHCGVVGSALTALASVCTVWAELACAAVWGHVVYYSDGVLDTCRGQLPHTSVDFVLLSLQLGEV